MVTKILPSDAGVEFSPPVLEHKEVLEETMAKNFGRKHPSDEDDSEDPSLSDSDDSSAEIEKDQTTPPVPEDDISPPNGEVLEESSPAKKPITPNPDFEPMRETVQNIDGRTERKFSSWVINREPEADGTYSVLFGEEGSYGSGGGITREEILEEARSEAEELRQQASVEGRQKGYEQGKEQAREELRAEMAGIFEELKKSINSVAEYRKEVLQSAEQEIFELAILISNKVIRSELQIRPEIILEVVRHALNRAVGWGKATAQVNPDDYSFLEENRIWLNDEAEGVNLVRIEANPSIIRGGCILESNFGEVDARLEKQVEAVENALREALAEKLDQQAEEAKDDSGGTDAAPEDPPEVSAEEIPALDEEQPPIQPFELKELDAPPEEPEAL